MSDENCWCCFFRGKNLESNKGRFSGLLWHTDDIGLYAFVVNALHHGPVCLKVKVVLES